MISRVLSLALFGLSLPALPADATGKWVTTFDTQIGDQKYTFQVKADGSKLTGKAISQWGEHELQDGKIAGDEVSFAETVEVDGNQLHIEYTGTITGDEMKVVRKVGDIATENAVAKREK